MKRAILAMVMLWTGPAFAGPPAPLPPVLGDRAELRGARNELYGAHIALEQKRQARDAVCAGAATSGQCRAQSGSFAAKRGMYRAAAKTFALRLQDRENARAGAVPPISN